MRTVQASRSRGYTMIELLVALLIFSFGALGMAGLLLHTLRVSKSGNFRAQAVALSSWIAESMQSNKAIALAGGYEVASGVFTPVVKNCETAACSGSELAAHDLNKWATYLGTLLPFGSGEITPIAGGNSAAVEYRVAVTWKERKQSEKSNSGATFENFVYTTFVTIQR